MPKLTSKALSPYPIWLHLSILLEIPWLVVTPCFWYPFGSTWTRLAELLLTCLVCCHHTPLVFSSFMDLTSPVRRDQWLMMVYWCCCSDVWIMLQSCLVMFQGCVGDVVVVCWRCFKYVLKYIRMSSWCFRSRWWVRHVLRMCWWCVRFVLRWFWNVPVRL